MRRRPGGEPGSDRKSGTGPGAPLPLIAFLTAAFSSSASAAFEGDGYLFEAIYTGEVLSNVSGGLETGTEYLDNLDLMLELDVPDLTGNGRGSLFLYGLYNNGATFAERYTGDVQVTSNIDAPEAWRIYEAWYEFGSEQWSVRAGLYDLNSEFDVNETGALFLNSSHGIGPEFSQTGENGPSIFPVSSLALRGDWRRQDVTVRVAILDGVPGHPDDPASNEINLGGSDGALLAAELDVALTGSARLWTGYWRYTAEFERPFAAGTDDDNHGWYIGVERSFVLGRFSASTFLRYGRANDELNVLQDYAGGGLVVDSPFPSRRHDQLGVAFASAGAGTSYRAHLERSGMEPAARETTWELTYRAQLTERIAVQPNVQLISNPAANASIEDALVIGLRFELAY